MSIVPFTIILKVNRGLKNLKIIQTYKKIIYLTLYLKYSKEQCFNVLLYNVTRIKRFLQDSEVQKYFNSPYFAVIQNNNNIFLITYLYLIFWNQTGFKSQLENVGI